MEGHIPVLKKPILEAFRNVSGLLLDGTFGGGGHTEALLEQNSSLNVTGLDVDPEAQVRAESLKQQFPRRFEFYPLNFSELEQLHKTFDGVLLDLGVSSFQLDNADRGFSFIKEGPLDMRMNPNSGIPASHFLKTATSEELTKAIRDYGEEPHWKFVVKSILNARETETWETTTEFVAFLLENTPLMHSKKRGIHPATRVFQGIRIAVNDELNHLEKGLTAAFNALNKAGILAVISFHSLEDRIVKQHFYEWCGRSTNRLDEQPRQLKTISAELLARKPIVATDEEVRVNPRARSAKLRILRKL
jgi:S-adenosyl-methyltransferase MraW